MATTDQKAKVDTLFISANFFGYAEEIRRELERRGRKVALFEDRPLVDNRTKALIRMAPSLMRGKSNAYFTEIVDGLRGEPIRDVFIIKGEALSPAAVRRMREAFPHARFTIYFWDSYRNMPADSREKAALFDRVFTFDPDDAAADPEMNYRPLFYLDDYARIAQVPVDIDVFFFGTIHGDRHAVLQRVEKALPPSLRFEKVLYLPARWMRWVRAFSDPSLFMAPEGRFIFKPKTKTELMNIFARSRIVVDIERAVQRGFTMRTIETLGAGRKLITTNPALAMADFFNPANILLVDRRDPVIPADFLAAPYEAPPADILRRYSLSGWLDEVLP